ncbi:MAG: sporulation protein [Bacteroidia bacterium]|nr:sporulation protein [Bacteroidia bacterium]
MGFFDKIKNKLGIGGVKVELKVPGQVEKASGVISGTVILTTKSDQEIKEIEIKVLEEYTTGRGDDKKTKTFTLGSVKMSDVFPIKTGETKEVPFTVNFEILKSNNDELAEKGGALGTLGKLGKFASNEKSAYFVEADVDVAAAALDPSDKKEIRMV